MLELFDKRNNEKRRASNEKVTFERLKRTIFEAMEHFLIDNEVTMFMYFKKPLVIYPLNRVLSYK